MTQCIISKKGKRVVEVSCGCEHSAALLETGAMYTWGHGAGGRLGISERDGSVVDAGDVAMPRRVTAMTLMRRFIQARKNGATCRTMTATERLMERVPSMQAPGTSMRTRTDSVEPTP